MRILGNPIKESTGWAREVALLFADASAAQAKAILRVRGLEAKIADAENKVSEGNALAASMRPGVAAGASILADAENAPKSAAEKVVVLVPAIAGSIALLATFTWLAGGFGFLAGLMIAMVIMGFVFTSGRKAKRDREAAVTTARAEHDRLTAEREQVLRSTHEWQERRDSLSTKKDGIRIERSVRAVGRVYVPVTLLDVAGYPILVDRSGTAPIVPVELPDLAAQPEVVERVRIAVQRADARPMLLAPSGSGPADMKGLYGEELELREAVHSFSTMIESIPVVKESLPLLPADSGLVAQAEAVQSQPAAEDVPGLVLRSKANDTSAVARVKDVATRMRSVGGNVSDELRGMHGRLSEVLKEYAGLRTDALREVHTHLQDVLMHSDLAYVSYYCPKCNRVPKYLFHRLGIDIDTAHELDADTLCRALQEDAETLERLVKDEQILADMSEALASVRELDATLAGWEDKQRESAGQLAADMTSMRAFDARLRAMRAQRAQAVAQFQSSMRKAVTGNPRPLLDLSKRARLHKHLDAGHWTCAVCDTVFDDPQVANMGRMLKIKDELLMPMWNHLWTEKDDLRKTELFRTNEQIQRLIEKEVAALRDVSEQYRADMRPVRENLIIATTEATQKREQLDATVESLAAMGAVSKEEARARLSAIQDVTGGDLGEFRKRAEAKETLLNQEPQSQMSRRIPAIDPVSVLMSPDTLFHQDRRLELALPEASESEGGSSCR